MQIDLLHRPGNSAARVCLSPGEHLTAESGSMIAMSDTLALTTTTHKRDSGSILKAIKRMLAGESFFINHYSAEHAGGEVFLAATLPGDMLRYDLRGENLIVQSGSFVACESSVDVNFGWQGFKSFFSGESIFWLQLSGTGPVILSSFGAIYPIEVDGEYIVDTGHIVAFQETLNFNITKAGGSWMTAILGGEGLVCRFSGRGTVWCQSHNAGGFGRELGPELKPR
ncbi:MAG: TIGR00266 family protein [Limisphaerales bacterium]